MNEFTYSLYVRRIKFRRDLMRLTDRCGIRWQCRQVEHSGIEVAAEQVYCLLWRGVLIAGISPIIGKSIRSYFKKKWNNDSSLFEIIKMWWNNCFQSTINKKTQNVICISFISPLQSASTAISFVFRHWRGLFFETLPQ